MKWQKKNLTSQHIPDFQAFLIKLPGAIYAKVYASLPVLTAIYLFAYSV